MHKEEKLEYILKHLHSDINFTLVKHHRDIKMPIQMQINGLEKVNKFLIEFPERTEKELNLVIDEFSKRVQKSAKIRAPRDTRELANSITVRPTAKNEVSVIVESPYGYFQEFGFRPHWIHTSMITGSNKFSQIYGGKEGFIFVAKSTPFLQPALETNLSNLPNMLKNGMDKAIKGAKR
jgi:hypothetical protein